jgi:hypothetical protein
MRPLGRPGVAGEYYYIGSWRSAMRGMDWIDLAWDRGRWQTLVSEVMNLQVS